MGGPCLPLAGRCYDPSEVFTSRGALPLCIHQADTDQKADLIGGAVHLLRLVDKARIAASAVSRFGISRLSVRLPIRGTAIAEPLVEHHAQALHKNRMRILPGLGPAMPRWPGGRRHAIVVTNDTDAVCYSQVQGILYSSVKEVRRRDPATSRHLAGPPHLAGCGFVREPEQRFIFFVYVMSFLC